MFFFHLNIVQRDVAQAAADAAAHAGGLVACHSAIFKRCGGVGGYIYAAALAASALVIQDLGIGDGGSGGIGFLEPLAKVDAAAVVARVALDGGIRNVQHVALFGGDAAAVAPGLVVADGGIRNGELAALGVDTAANAVVIGCFVVGYRYAVQGNIGFFTNGTDAAAAFTKCGRPKPAVALVLE